MLSYSEFLHKYFRVDTHDVYYPSDTCTLLEKYSVENNPEKAYKEYCKEEYKVRNTYDEYLRKKTLLFRRKLR